MKRLIADLMYHVLTELLSQLMIRLAEWAGAVPWLRFVPLSPDARLSWRDLLKWGICVRPGMEPDQRGAM